MNSWEEDAFFAEWGWEKDLIQRRFVGPRGHIITFDDMMFHTLTPEGEEKLMAFVRAMGKRQQPADA